ncbi:hypothetical protein [Streptomyces sp. NPDC051569]|uniref:hypothetical protein n=1 Tax=Streptomyces sp. NPDC051569 TaxID=3365661 RepID=UPI0037A172CC
MKILKKLIDRLRDAVLRRRIQRFQRQAVRDRHDRTVGRMEAALVRLEEQTLYDSIFGSGRSDRS